MEKSYLQLVNDLMNELNRVPRHCGEATARGKVGEGAEVRFSLPAWSVA
jgi:hypothetical protein